MLRHDRKLVLYTGTLSKADIQIFSAAGSLLGRIPWDGGRVAGAGWTANDELLVVETNGQVRTFPVIHAACHAQPTR